MRDGIILNGDIEEGANGARRRRRLQSVLARRETGTPRAQRWEQSHQLQLYYREAADVPCQCCSTTRAARLFRPAAGRERHFDRCFPVLTLQMSTQHHRWNNIILGAVQRQQCQQVNSEGVAVSHMEKGGFVGSMAFCRAQKQLSARAHANDGKHYDYHDGGMFRNAWEGVLEKLRKQGSVVGEVSHVIVGDKKLKRKDTTGFERSHSTVTATSDVREMMVACVCF